MRRFNPFWEPLTRNRHYAHAPRTWVPGEMVTAGMMNSIRDLFLEIEGGTAQYAKMASLRGIAASTSGVAVTLFTVTPDAAAPVGHYVVNSGIGSEAIWYAAFAVVMIEGNNTRIITSNGSNMFLTLSGNSVQGMQTSGYPFSIIWVALKIA
jgi:hypothetical protein